MNVVDEVDNVDSGIKKESTLWPPRNCPLFILNYQLSIIHSRHTPWRTPPSAWRVASSRLVHVVLLAVIHIGGEYADRGFDLLLDERFGLRRAVPEGDHEPVFNARLETSPTSSPRLCRGGRRRICPLRCHTGRVRSAPECPAIRIWQTSRRELFSLSSKKVRMP